MSETNGKLPTEFHRKHRPTRLKDVIGQDAAVKMLAGKLRAGELPHALLFTGPSGCGKSTVAGILGKKLGCGVGDFQKINCATLASPLDAIRSLAARISLSASGACRVWFLEEVQAFSRAPNAQQALLDMLEHPPPHAYFFLATTNPDKLLRAVRTRCTEVRLKALSDAEITLVLNLVCDREQISPSPIVLARIVEVSSGSAREALKHLNAVAGLGSDEEQLASIEDPEATRQAIHLCQALQDRRGKWAAVAAVLREVAEDPEDLRRAVLGYAANTLLKGADNARAGLILDVFKSPFYDSGRPGLVSACYEIFHDKS